MHSKLIWEPTHATKIFGRLTHKYPIHCVGNKLGATTRIKTPITAMIIVVRITAATPKRLQIFGIKKYNGSKIADITITIENVPRLPNTY